jgi:hypothetical protein
MAKIKNKKLADKVEKSTLTKDEFESVLRKSATTGTVQSSTKSSKT